MAAEVKNVLEIFTWHVISNFTDCLNSFLYLVAFHTNHKSKVGEAIVEKRTEIVPPVLITLTTILKGECFTTSIALILRLSKSPKIPIILPHPILAPFSKGLLLENVSVMPAQTPRGKISWHRYSCSDCQKTDLGGAEEFKHKWEFPQCAGAVDGTHIPIMSPEECPPDYFNQKGWHSVLMQGLVNHLGQFSNVYTCWMAWPCPRCKSTRQFIPIPARASWFPFPRREGNN